MVFSCLLFCLAFLSSYLVLAIDDVTHLGGRTLERTITLRTHSLYAPYIDQDLQNRWWDFGADAYINTNKHVRLTRNRASEMGWLWSRLPITSSNYVVEIEFKISGHGGHLFGDGIAVWLTKGRAVPGPVFGNMDKFEGLGVFLDTYANGRHSFNFPAIIGMVGDGKTEYDQAHDGDANSIGSCSANYRHQNVATKLRITYLKEGYLDVKIHSKAWDDWTPCFTVRNITLPDSPFIGISAMTGDVSDDHDIISVTTYSAILSNADTPRNKLHVGVLHKPRGWIWFIIKLFFFAGVVAGALYGYKTYSLRSAQNFNSYTRTPGMSGMGGSGGFFDNRRF